MSERLSTDARLLLARFAEETVVDDPPAGRERNWEQTIQRSRRARPMTGAIVTAALVAAAALAPALTPRSPAIHASEGARWQRHDDLVEVSVGQLRLQSQHQRLRAVTPQLQVELENGRALVDVVSGQTVLAVDEGEVVYRTARGEWRLKAGERVVISDRVESMTVASPARIRACGDDDAECLSRVEHGSGLAAEMALYRRGLLAKERGALGESVAAMREYGRRFPAGTFAPEASITLMLSLDASGETGPALDEAQRFVERFAMDPRVAEVQTWRVRHEEERP
jgi:hypothetical protein